MKNNRFEYAHEDKQDLIAVLDFLAWIKEETGCSAYLNCTYYTHNNLVPTYEIKVEFLKRSFRFKSLQDICQRLTTLQDIIYFEKE